MSSHSGSWKYRDHQITLEKDIFLKQQRKNGVLGKMFSPVLFVPAPVHVSPVSPWQREYDGADLCSTWPQLSARLPARLRPTPPLQWHQNYYHRCSDRTEQCFLFTDNCMNINHTDHIVLSERRHVIMPYVIPFPSCSDFVTWSKGTTNTFSLCNHP